MHGRRGPAFWLLAGFFGLFVLFLYGPTLTILVLSFQGPTGGLTFPMQGVSVHWFGNLFEKQMVGDFAGSFERSMALGVAAMLVTVVASFSAGLAFRTRFRGSATDLLSRHRQPDRALGPGQPGHRPAVPRAGLGSRLVQLGLRRPSHLDPAVRAPDHVRRLQPLRPALRGGGARPRRHLVADHPLHRRADPAAQPDRRRPVRLHALLRRVRAQPLHRRHLQHPAARDLRHDHQRHHAGALRAGHGDHGRVLPGDRHRAGVGHRACAAGASATAATPARRHEHASPNARAAAGDRRPAGHRAPGRRHRRRRSRSRHHRGHRRQDRGQWLRQRLHPRLCDPQPEAAAGREPEVRAVGDRQAGRHRHVGRHRGRAVAASPGVLPRAGDGARIGPAARHRRRPDARLRARGNRPRAADRRHIARP